MANITVNLDKAKEIHKNTLRVMRTSALEDLDAQFIRALEKGEDTSSIVNQKQELRDITKHPDLVNATTPEEVKAFVPEILNK